MHTRTHKGQWNNRRTVGSQIKSDLISDQTSDLAVLPRYRRTSGASARARAGGRYLGEAADAQCVLPACGGAVVVEQRWVGRHTAVHQRAVPLAQRHLAAHVAHDVRRAAELTVSARGRTTTKE